MRPSAPHREFRNSDSGDTPTRRIRGRSGGIYEIVRDLPTGGMAEAFVAMRRGLGGFAFPCCVKRMLGTEREEFLQEAHILGKLAHDRIVRAFEVDEDEDGVCFIAMELVDGVNLGQLLTHYQRRCRRMPPSLCIYVASEVLEALDYAYNRVVDGEPLHTVHRDVTPSNILLGRDGYVKLADFGIAKFNARPSFTRTGMAKGKGPYMSPEHYDRRRGLDHRSDLFSLGATLYEMLTGERAFYSDSEQETLYAVLHGVFAPLTELAPAVDPELAELVHRLLDPDKDGRPGDAEEVRERLRAFEPHPSPRSALAQEVEACMALEHRADLGPRVPTTGGAWPALPLRDVPPSSAARGEDQGESASPRSIPDHVADADGYENGSDPPKQRSPVLPSSELAVSAGADANAGTTGWVQGRRRMVLLVGGLAMSLGAGLMAPFIGSRGDPASRKAIATRPPVASPLEAAPIPGTRYATPWVHGPMMGSEPLEGGVSPFRTSRRSPTSPLSTLPTRTPQRGSNCQQFETKSPSAVPFASKSAPREDLHGSTGAVAAERQSLSKICLPVATRLAPPRTRRSRPRCPSASRSSEGASRWSSSSCSTRSLRPHLARSIAASVISYPPSDTKWPEKRTRPSPCA